MEVMFRQLNGLAGCGRVNPLRIAMHINYQMQPWHMAAKELYASALTHGGYSQLAEPIMCTPPFGCPRLWIGHMSGGLSDGTKGDNHGLHSNALQRRWSSNRSPDNIEVTKGEKNWQKNQRPKS